ncbi:MAG: hypothetical protein H7343_02325 [Undibacterium sp.]|nr:hypothetical protein [Opitutaceae bacterium]
MTTQEAFNSASNSGFNDLQLVLQLCEKRGPYCVIGDLAVNTYVRPVYTLDADLVVATHRLPEVSEALVNLGFKIEEETWSLNAQQPGSELRIQFTKDPRYQDFLATTQPAQVLGCPALVASLDNLIHGKSLAWSDPKRRLSKRKKDEADLIRIGETYPEKIPLLPADIRRQLDSV